MSERLQVFNILREWETTSLYIDSLTEKADLSHFSFRLIKGVVEKKILLDHVISQYASRKPNDDVRIILRIALYELLFNSSSQEYATVHEAVNLAGTIEPAAKGFVNAILRSFLRANKKNVLPEERIQKLCIEFSYPRWIIDMLLSYYSFDDVTKLLLYFERSDYCDIRINTIKISREHYCTLLDSAGIRYEQPFGLPHHVRLYDTGSVKNLPGYTEGFFYVQDAAAQMICELLLPLRGSLLDVGSAPGGKISYFAALNPHKYQLYALDASARRTKRLHENIERLGIDNVHTITSDFLSFTSSHKYSHIFIDAPCSGLGVLNGKADIKYRLKEQDILSLKKLQLQMLTHAIDLLEPDGEIVYSTCTLNRAENQDIVEEFRRANKSFRHTVLSEKNCLRSFSQDGIVSEEIWFSPFPPVHKVAGMFATILKR